LPCGSPDAPRISGCLRPCPPDALLSHLSYEEHELVEPLARLGFYASQV
jgi:hypothetical protein